MSNFDISTVRGDSWLGFQATIIVDGVPLDLTGAKIRMQLRKTADDCQYALEFSSLNTETNTITITNPLSGQFQVDPVVIDITPRVYLYDTEITTSSGRVLTVIKGLFTVSADVTKD